MRNIVFCVSIAAMVEFIGRSFRVLAYFNWIWYCVFFLPIERYEIFDRRVFAVSDIQLLFWSGARNINKGNLFVTIHIFLLPPLSFPYQIIWLFLVCVENVVGSIIQWLSSMVFFLHSLDCLLDKQTKRVK